MSKFKAEMENIKTIIPGDTPHKRFELFKTYFELTNESFGEIFGVGQSALGNWKSRGVPLAQQILMGLYWEKKRKGKEGKTHI